MKKAYIVSTNLLRFVFCAHCIVTVLPACCQCPWFCSVRHSRYHTMLLEGAIRATWRSERETILTADRVWLLSSNDANHMLHYRPSHWISILHLFFSIWHHLCLVLNYYSLLCQMTATDFYHVYSYSYRGNSIKLLKHNIVNIRDANTFHNRVML